MKTKSKKLKRNLQLLGLTIALFIVSGHIYYNIFYVDPKDILMPNGKTRTEIHQEIQVLTAKLKTVEGSEKKKIEDSLKHLQRWYDESSPPPDVKSNKVEESVKSKKVLDEDAN